VLIFGRSRSAMKEGIVVLSSKQLEALIEEVVERILQQTNSPTVPEEWLSLKEACAYLTVSKPTLYRMRLNGVLKGRTIGRKVLFRRSELDAFLEKC